MEQAESETGSGSRPGKRIARVSLVRLANSAESASSEIWGMCVAGDFAVSVDHLGAMPSSRRLGCANTKAGAGLVLPCLD
jgi:hypothetical protein